MGSHQVSTALAAIAGGALVFLVATAAFASDCSGGRCNGAWVSATPGYEIVPAGYAAQTQAYGYQGQRPYTYASPCEAACGYAPPAPVYAPQPQPYPVQPCGAPVGYACGYAYPVQELSVVGDWAGGVGVTEYSGGGGGGGGEGGGGGGPPLAGFGDISGFVGSHAGAGGNSSSSNASSVNVNVRVNTSAAASASSSASSYASSTSNSFSGGVGQHHGGHGGGGKPQGGCGCVGSSGGSGGMGGWSGGAGNSSGAHSPHAVSHGGRH